MGKEKDPTSQKQCYGHLNEVGVISCTGGKSGKASWERWCARDLEGFQQVHEIEWEITQRELVKKM